MNKDYKDWVWQKKYSPKPKWFAVSVFSAYCNMSQEATKMWITEEHEKSIVNGFKMWQIWDSVSMLPI